jgi:hypothetical protein
MTPNDLVTQLKVNIVPTPPEWNYLEDPNWNMTKDVSVLLTRLYEKLLDELDHSDPVATAAARLIGDLGSAVFSSGYAHTRDGVADLIDRTAGSWKPQWVREQMEQGTAK